MQSVSLKTWLLISLAAGLIGCSSSSSSSPIPNLVPALGSAAAAQTSYTGVLVHTRPGLGPSMGWRIRNATVPGSVPVDVSKVAQAAKELAGKQVVITAHSVTEPDGRLVLQADSLAAN